MTNATTEAKSTLRLLIDSRGLRYSWVAQKVGVAPSTLTQLMNGSRRARADVAERLAALLEVRVCDLGIEVWGTRVANREDAA